MKTALSVLRRMWRVVRLLPETTSNSIRFRVFFILPRWFRMPKRVRVGSQAIALDFPNEDGMEAAFIECFLRNAYGLGRKLGQVRTIVDVGANAGFFSLAARGIYPGARIHAYEPNPRMLPFLRANTAEMDVQAYAEAVGGSDGFVRVIDVGPSDRARTCASEGGDGAVRQVSLATVVERMGGEVDLLKLDCEGAEWEILTPNGCWKAVRNVRMEYHLFDGQTVEEARKALAENRFKIVYLREHSAESGVIWAARE
jgi:FkbM family methyltransferase